MADNTAWHPVPGQFSNHLLTYVNTHVYKCAGANDAGRKGTPVYQDSPCADGALLRDFTANPANVSVLPMSKRMPLHADDPNPSSATKPKPSAKRAKRHPTEHFTVDANANAKASGRSNANANANPDTEQRAGERRNLRLGMTEGEILARVGRPDLKGAGEARKASARWTYLPAAGDPQTVTTIALEKGKAVAIDRTVAR